MATKKEPLAMVKLQVPAGKAEPTPPIGPALGQHGLNLMDFCKKFNEATKGLEPGLPIPVVIWVYEEKKFDFMIKTTPAAILLRNAAGLKKASGRPNTEKVGTVTRQQVEEIVKQKQKDLTAKDMEAAVRTIAGTARSMGIELK